MPGSVRQSCAKSRALRGAWTQRAGATIESRSRLGRFPSLAGRAPTADSYRPASAIGPVVHRVCVMSDPWTTVVADRDRSDSRAPKLRFGASFGVRRQTDLVRRAKRAPPVRYSSVSHPLSGAANDRSWDDHVRRQPPLLASFGPPDSRRDHRPVRAAGQPAGSPVSGRSLPPRGPKHSVTATEFCTHQRFCASATSRRSQPPRRVASSTPA